MAFGTATVSNTGGAVGDLFAGFGHLAKAKGDELEGQNYQLAAAFAGQNVEFTKESTAVKQAQTQREIYKGLGQTQAGVAASGFTMSGSGLDILREGAQQGALTQQVASQQGLITEAGYKEQQDAYNNMAQAADVAARAEKTAATGAFISAGFHAATAIASLYVA